MDRLGMMVSIEFEAYDKVNSKLETLLKRLQNSNKLNIEVDASTFNKLEQQFNKLKKQISKNLGIDIDNNALSGLSDVIDKLDKKQIKLIDKESVQLIEQSKKSLIETQKVITNLRNGSQTVINTSDYGKAQSGLYLQLNSLQNQEFALKQRMVGQEDEIKNQLQEQINLVKQQQLEVGKLINQNSLIDSSKNNEVLISRKALMSDLTIAQEKYNNKVKTESEDVQNKINLYQKKMNTEIQSLQGKYKDLVPSKQLTSFQESLSKLNATSLKGLQNEVRKLDNEFKQLTVDTKENGLHLASQDSRGLSSLLTKDIIAFASWKVIGDAVMMAYRQIGNSVRYVYDMDTALVSLKKITNETADTYRQFEIEANSVARSIARGSVEVIDATVAWKKAGYTLNEAKQLSSTTLIGANVGDVSVQEIQQYLVAPLKAWKVEAQDSIKILDIMNNVSNQHAVTIQDLGQAYSRASSVMAMANNSIQETTALVTAAQAQTQLGGDTIGNGLRTIALRLTSMKDEEGNIIPKLAEDFDKVGVKLKDTNGNLLSTYEIIKQLNKVWNSGNLTQEEKLNLLEKGAGKMRSNILAAMIENFGEAEKTLSDSLNSSNSAIKEQEAYMQSLEAKVKVFGETIKSIYQKIIVSDTLKDFVDFGTKTAISMGNLVEKFGALPLTVGAATAALALFKKNFNLVGVGLGESGGIQFNGSFANGIKNALASVSLSIKQYNSTYAEMINQQVSSQGVMQPTLYTRMSAGLKALTSTTIAQTVATGMLKVATLALNAAIGMGIGLLISGAVSAITKMVNKANEATDSLKGLTNEMTTLNQNDRLVDKYKDLETQLSRTVKGSQEYISLQNSILDVQKQLAQAFPSLIDSYTKEGEAIVSNSKKLDEYIEKKRTAILAEAGTKYEELHGQLTKKVAGNDVDEKWYEKMFDAFTDDKSLPEAISLIEQYNDVLSKANELANKGDLKGASKFAETANKIEEKIRALNEASIQLYSIGMKDVEIYDFQSGKMVKYSSIIEQNTEKVKENSQANQNNASSIESLKANHEQLNKAFEESTNKLEAYNKFQSELQSSNKLSADSIQEVISKYPELLAYIGNESEMRGKLSELIKGEEDAQRQAYTNILMNSEEFYNAKIRGNAEMQNAINSILSKFVDAQGNAYKVDLENYKTMEQVKASVSTQLIQNLAGAWARYWDATTQSFSNEFWYGMRNDTEGTAKAHEMVDQIKAVIDSLQNISTKGLDLSTIKIDPIKTGDAQKQANEAYEIIKTVEDKIRSLIEKQIEAEKKALDDRLKNYEDFIQKKLKALDDEYKAEDYKEQLAQEQKKKAELEAQQQALLLDSSAEARVKKEDIAKQIEEQQKVIDDIIKGHDRETRKDNLNQQLEAERARIEKMKADLDAKFTPEQIEQMVKNSIISGTLVSVNGELINLRDAYIDFENKFGEGMSILGQKIKDEFLTKLQQAKDLIQSMGINGIISDATAAKIVGSHANGGIIDSTGLRMFHGSSSNPELVLNTAQASKVYDLFAFIKNMPRLTIPGVKRINDVQPITIQTDSFIRVDGNVDDSTIPKLDVIVDKVAEKIVTTMYKRGQAFA